MASVPGQLPGPVVPEAGDEPIDSAPIEEEMDEHPVEGPEGVLPVDIVAALEGIVDHIENTERLHREGLLRLYKRNQLFWNGYQYLYWSDVAGDWQGPQLSNFSNLYDPELEQDLNNFTKVINVYKSHGESIIGALSTGLPSVRFFPEDPDNPNDILTASTKGKIAEIIQDQNKAQQKFVHILYLLWNYGYIGAYNSHHNDHKYGTVTKPRLGMESQNIQEASCPLCNQSIDPESETLLAPGTQSTDEEVFGTVTDKLAQKQNCPYCGESMVPMVQEHTEEVPVQTGIDELPKGREILEFYGPLNLHIPVTARRTEDVGWCMLDDEYDYAQIRSIFPKRWKDIQPGGNWNTYERWARHMVSLENLHEQVTVRRVWLKPHMFWTIDDEALRSQLFQLYPHGCYIAYVNDQMMETTDEDMDLHWTFYKNPTAESIATSEPIGKPLIPVQELTNDAFNITVQQMQYGIGETFVDQEVIDFDNYKKLGNDVGMMYPVQNPNPGTDLGANFYQLRAATMSKEIEAFMEKLEHIGQFVSGSFPSIYGGPSTSGSNTLGEYEQSRNQSLQRLAIPWKTVNDMWADIMNKAVTSFIDNMLEDMKHVKASQGNFVSIWIRQSELQGKTGAVISETSEAFPLSWSQKGAVLFKLLEMGDPNITATLFSPDNIGIVNRTFGLTELKLPGEDDRNKQLTEISQMLKGEFVEPDEMLDNHELEASVCRNWLISNEGMDAKMSNPQGYQMVYMHFMGHQQQVMQAQMEEEAAAQEGAVEGEEETVPE